MKILVDSLCVSASFFHQLNTSFKIKTISKQTDLCTYYSVDFPAIKKTINMLKELKRHI